MVAQTLSLPNVRKLFVPDPGYLIGECDLSGADAQVVAWEAEDEGLKAAFRAGLKVHLKNARDIFPEQTDGMTDQQIKDTDHPGGIYHDCKRSVHGTNYGVTPWSLAGKLGWPTSAAKSFQANWFGLHPGIKVWQERVQAGLYGRIEGLPPRTVRNKFGYRIIFFDRAEGLLPEALAWGPQSTVGITCAKGALLAQHIVQVLLQVHDSFIFQTPIEGAEERFYRLNKALHSVFVPYDDPLTIPWKLTVSDKSWGHAQERAWPT